jgi:acetolactate synthase small subunit
MPTLTVLFDDRAGALVRVLSTLQRRGAPPSFLVAKSMSRQQMQVTALVDVEPDAWPRLQAALRKLVDVIHVHLAEQPSAGLADAGPPGPWVAEERAE